MLPLLKKTTKGPIAHLLNLLKDSDYRRWSFLETKYRLYPRYKKFNVKDANLTLTVPDSHSFLAAYKVIFRDKAYQFKSTNIKPYIIDIGSNIGLSVLFFKKIYPEAAIIAIESDPTIFQYLQSNVHGNGFTDVTLINKAAWHENTVLQFSVEGADAGRIAYNGDENLISVQALDISSLLGNTPVDLLKIDIEGAEKNVLEACREKLSNVHNMIVEYHSKTGEEQQLDTILAILREAGFRVHIHAIRPSPVPLIKIKTQYGFDQQLNIFAWRE